MANVFEISLSFQSKLKVLVVISDSGLTDCTNLTELR